MISERKDSLIDPGSIGRKLKCAVEPVNSARRTFIGGAVAALLASPRRARADDEGVPNDPFILLLHGLYQPVPLLKGPADNLGLANTVNLSDGSYSRTQIYPILGVDGANDQKKSIGNFYVSLQTGLCAYQLPGGAIAMQFTGGNFSMIIPDGRSGQYDEGTFELNILEATGVYSAFKGGHNHMVDRLHQLAAGPPFAGFPLSGYDEFCFCIISRYPFP
jgi:hypothetical protein